MMCDRDKLIREYLSIHVKNQLVFVSAYELTEKNHQLFIRSMLTISNIDYSFNKNIIKLNPKINWQLNPEEDKPVPDVPFCGSVCLYIEVPIKEQDNE